MLSYLVSSRARRNLLHLLWIEGTAGSVSALARLAGVGFATAYRELKQMERAGLAQSECLGGSVVYKANKFHPQARTLLALLKPSKEKPPAGSEQSEQTILISLKTLGAPLDVEERTTPSLPPEETLAKALRLSHLNATVARAIPLVFALSESKINFERLKHLAKLLGEQRTLGFFANLTAVLTGKQSFHQLANSLFDRRVSTCSNFFLHQEGKYTQKLTKKNTPPLAKKWHYWMNMGMDGFEDVFKKFHREKVQSH